MMNGFQRSCRGMSSQERPRTIGKKIANSIVGKSMCVGFAPLKRAAMLVNVLAVLALGTGTASAACGGVEQVKPQKDVNLGRAPVAIGDSPMLLALPNLAHEGYRANARGCRQWPEGLDVIRKLKHEGHL